MSYGININGHKDVGTPEEGKAFEEEVIAKVKEFVDKDLEGVTFAQLSGANVGTVNLLSQEAGEDATE